MRLVVYGKGADDTVEPQIVGWFHVSKDGFLENFSQPCQASIHRFDMEWPEDCTNLDHMLAFTESDGKTARLVDGEPDPSAKTLHQLDAARKSR
jgi:hypothetical protein